MYGLHLDRPHAHEMYTALFDQLVGGWLRLVAGVRLA